ncbi:MAG: serine/threonine-protein kinase [Polyangiaceae bacterium]
MSSNAALHLSRDQRTLDAPEGAEPLASAVPGSDRDACGPGDVVADKYEILSQLGEGGMGTVWLARNRSLDMDVALKLIRRDVADEETTARFVREAKAAARLQHPAVIRVYDYGTSSRGEPYMVMELLRGKSLGEVLDEQGRMLAAVAVTTMLPIASGLAVVHDEGIVHRDLKPDNVLIANTADGEVRPVVMDFGIAKLNSTSTDTRLTQERALVGTPDYMSPEQACADGDIDARSDIWGLCVMLYELIAGERPFVGESRRELFAAIVTGTPKSLAELGYTDEVLWKIIERGLAKNRDDRWPSMRELGAALAAWASDSGLESDASGLSLARWLGGVSRSRPDSQSRATVPFDGAVPGRDENSSLKDLDGLTRSPMASLAPGARSRFGAVIVAGVMGLAGAALGAYLTSSGASVGGSTAAAAVAPMPAEVAAVGGARSDSEAGMPAAVPPTAVELVPGAVPEPRAASAKAAGSAKAPPSGSPSAKAAAPVRAEGAKFPVPAAPNF